MAEFGKTVLKANAQDYIEFHGHKRSIMQWVEGFGDSWADCFRSIPFGGLEMYGFKIKPGIIVRVAKNTYICETKEDFEKNYYKF